MADMKSNSEYRKYAFLEKATRKIRTGMKIERDGDGFVAYSPKLKGLITCGDTMDEVRKNADDAATAYVRSLFKHRDPQLFEFTKSDDNKGIKDG